METRRKRINRTRHSAALSREMEEDQVAPIQPAP